MSLKHLRRHGLHRWIVLQDRRHRPRARWCSDTRAAQYFLAATALLVSSALLLAWLGVIEPQGAAGALFVRSWGLVPVLAGLLTGSLHLLSLRYERGCNWACWLCCNLHFIFWSWVAVFISLLGYFGFTLIFFTTSALALWASSCLLRPLEDRECDNGRP